MKDERQKSTPKIKTPVVVSAHTLHVNILIELRIKKALANRILRQNRSRKDWGTFMNINGTSRQKARIQ